MAKFIAWVSFPVEVEADDEEAAFDIALETVSEGVETCGEINITSVQSADEDETEGRTNG